MRIPGLLALIISFAGVSVCSTALAADFTLTSPEVGPDKPLAQDFVFSGFGCTGGNQSPALAWNGAPAGAKSFAVALYDPDAMAGKGFPHWLMVNIPATTTALARDAGKNDGSKAPAGAVQIKNGFRATGYSGSCPPPADEPHGYVYSVYALKVEKLEVPADASYAAMMAEVEANSIGKATLGYKFGRKPKTP
jgi:Raf kinase inhibitor-like YbhB/YbcL family protein